MNFVRAETIVQEITVGSLRLWRRMEPTEDDGKVRDIITQVKKTDAPRGQPLIYSLYTLHNPLAFDCVGGISIG